MKPRRALLYMPGDDERKIRKAAELGVDSICMDLEDGVAYSKKQVARDTIKRSIEEVDFRGSEILVRINSVGSGLEEIDLETMLPAVPDGIVLPKVQSAEQIRWVDETLNGFEVQLGMKRKSIALIGIIESALGIVNLKEIAGCVDRLEALIFGAEDYTSDIGARRSKSAWEVLYARSAVVAHAAANGIQPIDMVYVDFLDIEGLYREAKAGAELGFTGKQIIHPNQVGPVQDAFTPDDRQIQDALTLLREFDSYQAQGIGAFQIQGKMVDAPMIRAAELVLQKAKAAGKL